MTRPILAAFAALAIAGCGSEAPPPKPAPKAQAPAAPKPAPAPQAAPAPAAPPQAAAPAPAPDPNALLAEQVKKALEALRGAAIDVSASDGVVSLFGTVGSNEEKRRAAAIAGKVAGVKSVQNKLVVVSGS